MARCKQPPPKSALENRQEANKITALIVPAILIGIVGYVTWIVVVVLSVNFLIKQENRSSTGVAIIVLHFVFLFPMACSYLRIFSTLPHPGYTDKRSPCIAAPVKPPQEAPPQRNVQASCTTTTIQEGTNESDKKPRTLPPQEPPVTVLDTKEILSGQVPPPPGTEHFYSKEVFACDQNGLPIWCGVCNNWKPDRSHHSSDVGRCVLKLDHFCAFVGGLVSERNFNFFIQFTSYAALYALFVLIVVATHFDEARSRSDTGEAHLIAALALGSVFTMFAGGMAMTSMSFVFKAVTTIDNIGHQRRVMHLAVLIEDPSQNRLPRPMSSASTDQMFGAENSEDPWQGIITYPLNVMPDASSETTLTPRVSSSSPPLRTFAILRTHAGMNPWNLGPFRNFKAIMGNHWFDWVLPLRQSPCCDHDRGDSMYELGPDVEQLKIDAGLSTLDNRRRSSRRRHRKNRHLGEDDEDLDNMGSTLANVNGSTGRDRGSYESI